MESSGSLQSNSRNAEIADFFRRLVKNPAPMAVLLGIFMFIVGGILRPESINRQAIGSILFSTVLLSIAAGGQTLVLISGGLDFTIGAVMSASALIATHIMNGQPGRFFLVLLIALPMGMAVGFANGFSVVKIGLPAMIVTMAIANVVTRLTYVFTAGVPSGLPSEAFKQSVIMRIGNWFPIIVVWGVAFWAIMFYILNFSRFGKQVYLVGNNPVAANLCGVKVNKIRILTYMISGMMAAFVGILAMGYSGFARCQLFDEYAFKSLVAVIVGGTSFSGGVGTYYGSIAGAFMMTVLSNTLTIVLTVFNLPSALINIINGAVLLVLLISYSRGASVRQ